MESMSAVHFKFRNSLQTEIIHFPGDDISVKLLTDMIAQKKGLKSRLNVDFKLSLSNADTKEEYSSQADRIKRNSVVLVQRKKVFKVARLPRVANEGMRRAGLPTKSAENHFARDNSHSHGNFAVAAFSRVPVELRCAVSRKLMVDPVRLPCCEAKVSRCMVETALITTGTCPLCRSEIDSAMLVPVPAIRSRVEELLASGTEPAADDVCHCGPCKAVLTRTAQAKSPSSWSPLPSVASTEDVEDRLVGRKRKVEDEDEQGYQPRPLASWNFNCTTEFKRRAAERFMNRFAPSA